MSMSGWLRSTALLATVSAIGCGGETAAPVAGDEFQATAADQILFDLRHNMTVGGVRQALLVADTALLYEDSAAVEVRQMHLTLFDEQGRQAADLTADSGELNTRTEAMVARGHVVLLSQGGARRIETEELHFDPNGDRIWSDVPTTLREDGTVVRGSGFTATAGLEDITIHDPTGRFEDVEVEVR